MKALIISCLLASFIATLPVYAEGISKDNENTMMLKRTNYPSLPEPAGPYSVSVRHNNTLYLSGITAFGTAAQGKSMAQQADVIFKQIKRVTDAEGISMRDLIKVTVFVTSMDNIGALREILVKHYDGAFPASSLVRVAGLFSPEASIEIEAVFALPS